MPIWIAPRLVILHAERIKYRFVRFFRWAMPFEICYEPISNSLILERLMESTVSERSLESPKERLSSA